MQASDRAPRYRVGGMNIIYDTGEGFWAGPVVDASESGLFVETVHELVPGTRVTLIPDVDGDDALPFEIEADVVRINEYDLDSHSDRTPGLAFSFVGLTIQQASQVRSFLAQHGVAVR